ncbi:isoleucine--tRNA ligase [Candidatus Saccharibacteria bacterium]|nr:isoleucine--tRNA ligase [Candidatus Saccharibacteria bacterium]MBR2995000.1 isoleucine--tRNA ligase [Candidatus Saccharibacteria bacterium]MBR2995049.1 isoleucine--tRNA ligase [Candidatus Saccharibacteria bacterium]
MKYRAGERRKAIEYEKAITEWWKKNKTFEKSVENRPIDKSYVFYDGPPFITGNPHHGTLLSSIVKDAVPRFWTMNGYRVERRWGWDCHGLPAENFVEKQLGITDRRDIGTKWTLEDYIIKARESMVANSETWRSTIDRVGRWVDFDNCYRTMNKDFMESVWWAFKQLYEAGKIYEGRKVLMYDTKFATPVSKAEVTMDNDAYQVVTDPSAYVKFKLIDSGNSFSRGIRDNGSERSEKSRNDGRDEASREKSISESIYLLAWTTTPWTLPGNMCLAVNPDLSYGIYNIDGENFILASDRAKVIFKDVKPEITFKGSALVGKKYEPIIEIADGLFDLGLRGDKGTVQRNDTYTVLPGDFVSAEDGTGIVHIAPAYGEDDYALAQQHEVDFVDCLDENGYYLPEMADKLHALGVRDTDEYGIQIWAANKFIAKVLEEKGIIYRIEYIQHEYPFNPRSKERIMYRAFPSWFFDIEGQKQLMLDENENINWFPAHLKHGRFAKNIEQAPDWNLSRDRFWATAMPVWKGDKGSVKVVGSYAELKELSGKELNDYHRPWVDEITFDIDGEHFTRIEKVLDCWFESGSMPFAQLHYPFENKEKFERNYPADFIVEYVGQVRAWFYYVHAVNTTLATIGAFGEKAQTGHKNAYKNVITTGTLAGNDGRKMSKSLGNYTDPNLLMDQYSADALRFLLLSSPVLSGEDFALLDKDVSDINRKLAMIWNVYDFFTTYAEVENIDSMELEKIAIKGISEPGKARVSAFSPVATGENDATRNGNFSSSNPLDVWIISRIYQLRNDITAGMQEYNLPKALEGVLPFIDDMSNWFVRRSRRRFSKNSDENDKNQAFATLYYVLVYLSKLLAPFTPFLAEELYQKMTGSDESVHLLNWPDAGKTNHLVLDNMQRTREIITDALALRMQKTDAEEQIKIRQPLAKLTYDGDKLDSFYEGIIADEVNVKAVENSTTFSLDKTLTTELLEEGRAREIIRAVQSARKHASLRQDDKIKLSLSCDLPKGFEELIKTEVGATEIVKDSNYSHDEIAKINGNNITISLEKL